MNYRLGRKTQKPRECLIKILGLDSSKSQQMIGWRVGWPADDPVLWGKIVKPHGRKGTMRGKFKKGVPGQALNSRVKIIP